jgi:hypothetical protein
MSYIIFYRYINLTIIAIDNDGTINVNGAIQHSKSVCPPSTWWCGPQPTIFAGTTTREYCKYTPLT